MTATAVPPGVRAELAPLFYVDVVGLILAAEQSLWRLRPRCCHAKPLSGDDDVRVCSGGRQPSHDLFFERSSRPAEQARIRPNRRLGRRGGLATTLAGQARRSTPSLPKPMGSAGLSPD